ncbi:MULTISPECIES: WXG100 family type VII secretion target [Antrihabitans]|jgi:WXG100 family type VII secretion target|uniref:ESAT-6-like protein n=2 Tax=Antrihabitans TaxID=2799491 RepID=A0A934U1W9_9NOCA|nr:WXG100 family type VII secretion target [Antrihabitans stalagmiti]MBJ8338610.1 WXG100 family type VII secretion target [Antrihabitans stalagmiti]
MAGVITDVGAMEAAAGHVETVNGQMQRYIADVRAQAESSGAAWKGDAGTAFRLLMTQYDEASVKIQRSLQTIADRIRENGKGYDVAEQANQEQIHSTGASSQLLDIKA